MRFTEFIKKESLQFLRNRVVLIFSIYLFTLDIILAGKGLGIKLKNAQLALWDMCKTPSTRELTWKMVEPYFRFSKTLRNWDEFERWIKRGDTAGALIIPPEFEKDLSRKKGATIFLALDGSIITTTVLSSSYTSSIVSDFNRWAMKRWFSLPLGRELPRVDARWRVEFNPNLESSYFGAFSELFMNVTLMTLIITALSFVREKDYGTIEQILVSPVGFHEFSLSKTLFVLITMLFFVASSTIFVIKGVLSVPLKGSFALFMLISSIDIVSNTGIGFAVAGLSDRISQVGLMTALFIVPIIFLSGGWVPPESMPSWIKPLTNVSPLKYYMDLGLSVALKGSGFQDIWFELLKSALLSIILLLGGYVLLRKRTIG